MSQSKQPGVRQTPDNDAAELAARLSQIKNKIIVMSGKGGVGKSTTALNLAVSLAMSGHRTGLLDVDIHGPSIPTMLSLTGREVLSDGKNIIPIAPEGIENLKVISIGFLLDKSDSPVIWRGPMKGNLIKQFIKDVAWGELDYLIVDCPPGTGDEPLSAIQLLDRPDGAVLVTTPQGVSAIDVSKSINFCNQLALPVIGIVENMSGFACPHCGKVTDIFSSGGGKKLAEKYEISFLGSVPIDPAIGTSCDDGTPYVKKYSGSATSDAFNSIGKAVSEFCESRKKQQ